MFDWLKDKFKKKKFEDDSFENDSKYTFKWYEISDTDNPFNKRVLDIRPLTWNLLSTTSQPEIAHKYTALRNSTGENHRGTLIENEESARVNLVYPHNGEKLEGVIFKSAEMECKWDIYIYDNCFYFVRSWSDELLLKACAEINEKSLIINEIFYSPEKYDEVEAANTVHFLIKSHAFGQPFPHKVPDTFSGEKEIALYSFSLFGNKACYATFQDITDTVIIEN